MNELKTRLEKIKKLKNEVDSILLLGNDPNFFYFTNSYANEFFLYDFRKPRIISTTMGEQQVKASWVKNIKTIDVINTKKKFLDLVLENVKGVVGVNKKSMNAGLFGKIKRKASVRDVSDELDEARTTKTNYEIRQIKKSCSINRKVFQKINGDIRNGISEQELCGLTEYEVRRRGAQPFVIVAFGKNTASPHHEATDKKLRKGEPVLIDLVCRYKGYHSDVTRTFRSSLVSRMEKIMEEVTEMIEPGMKARRLDEHVRKQLGGRFTTSLGHGIGVAVHERPWLYRKSKDILKEGMVFAIEPGLYLKNQGARLENDFLLTKRGFANLTNF